MIDKALAAEPPGTFDFTETAARNLYAQSWLVASALDNLTTKCAGKGRVTLRAVTHAPFGGRLTTVKDDVMTAIDYTGKLTIRDHLAILDLDRPAEEGEGRIHIHAEVSEDGQIVLRQTALPRTRMP
jgi:hypothetical protein